MPMPSLQLEEGIFVTHRTGFLRTPSSITFPCAPNEDVRVSSSGEPGLAFASEKLGETPEHSQGLSRSSARGPLRAGIAPESGSRRAYRSAIRGSVEPRAAVRLSAAWRGVARGAAVSAEAR